MATTPLNSFGPEPGPVLRALGSPRIWAVGGGKGGVGKSVVTTNLAAAIAGSGRRCVVIDVDLGAANLHTLLGVPRPRHSLTQLLTGDVESLAELLVQTSIPNLSIVSGHQALLEMANPKPSEKELLFTQICELDVDDVFLDLGAGSAFNVLDFFLLAARGLVVVTPEPTAIENAEHFVRAAFYRSLRDVARRPDVASAIRRLREDGSPRRVRSAAELIGLVRAIDPPAAKPLEERARTFRPLLVVNQVRNPEQRTAGPRLVATCRERLGVDAELVASFDADPNVAEAVVRGQAALQAFPLCRFSRQIGVLAERLQQGLGEAVPAGRVAAPGPVRTVRAPAAPVRRLPPFEGDRPGAYLRRCREGLGLSLAELAERTRIRILDDIESERFECLPPEPYLKGYLLEYARELGVAEIAELVRSYLAKCPVPRPAASGPPSAARAPGPPARRRGLRRWRRD